MSPPYVPVSSARSSIWLWTSLRRLRSGWFARAIAVLLPDVSPRYGRRDFPSGKRRYLPGCEDQPARAARTAASASTVPGADPHAGTVVEAVWRSSVRVRSTSPRSFGFAAHIRATTPATWGVAMEVPDRAPYPPPGSADTTATPGASTSGFPAPPRLEKDARCPFRSTAPTPSTDGY